MELPPSRWDRPPAVPTVFQNNSLPLNVHVSIAPRFSNENRQDSTAAILGAFVLGMAAAMLLGVDPSKSRK